MAKIEINIRKIEENVPKRVRMIQRNIFNTLCKKIFAESESNPSTWTKEEWDDPHKVFVMEDTLDNCTKAYNEWVDMSFQTWDKLKVSIKESRLYRTMPIKIRRFVINPNKKDEVYYQKFQDFLNTIGIVFTIELISGDTPTEDKAVIT